MKGYGALLSAAASTCITTPFYSFNRSNNITLLQFKPPSPALTRQKQFLLLQTKQRNGDCNCATFSLCSGAEPARHVAGDGDNFIVVNFYCFVFIKDAQSEVVKHLSFMEVFIRFFLLLFSLLLLQH